MIGCRRFLTQLPATSALYTRLVTTHQSFIIYIGYHWPTRLNLKYCYLSTQLSLVLPKESGSYNLRSKLNCEFKVPKTKCKTLGDRTFARVGPRLWSTLPWAIRSIRSLQGFKQGSKDLLISFGIGSVNQFVYSDCDVLFSLSPSVLSVMCSVCRLLLAL